jgi:hypothetical protein
MKATTPSIRITAAIAMALLYMAISMPVYAGNNFLDSNTCRDAIGSVERSMKLPIGIMQAISLAESGRWDKISRSGFAWPWTVTAHGRGQFYPSKQAAIAAVRKLKAKGVKNIDVGCMQVNLM